MIYTSAVRGPRPGPEFGRDFQSTYFDDWLRWTGISEIDEIRYHPTLTGDAGSERVRALAAARSAARGDAWRCPTSVPVRSRIPAAVSAAASMVGG